MNGRLIVRWVLGPMVAGLLAVLVVRVLPFLSLVSLGTHQRELSTHGAAHPVGMIAMRLNREGGRGFCPVRSGPCFTDQVGPTVEHGQELFRVV